MKIISILITVTLFTFSCKENKVDNDKRNIQILCDQIMEKFKTEKYKEGTDQLKQISFLDSTGLDTLAITMSKELTSYSEIYGKINSVEYLGEKKVGNFLVHRFYALKFDRSCLKFQFTLYKNNYYWRLTGFNYNDEFKDLFN